MKSPAPCRFLSCYLPQASATIRLAAVGWIVGSQPARRDVRDKLTKLQIDRLQAPGRHGDGGGLWLQVTKRGTKSWLLRYQIDGRARHMGLGAFPDVSLTDARERARIARLRLSEGFDPIEERNQRRAEQRRAQAATILFRDAAKAVIADREGGWSREHRRQWLASMAQVDPILGGLPVATIDTALVMKAVEPIWRKTQVTGERLRQRIEVVLDWAQARGCRTGDNPARWRAHLQHLLPDTASVKHLAALPYVELPAFMQKLRAREGVAFRALEFTILTGVRTGEALGAAWSEIEGDVWAIPGERMKAGKPHVVPLSGRALEIISALARDSPHIFAAPRTGRMMERHALNDALKAMDVDGVTVHGFRSSFSDWASERTSYAPEVREMALAHSIPNKVEAAYRRGDLLEKRRRLMRDWDGFCSAPPPDGDVVPLRGRRP
jgi:integrase